MIIIFLPNDRKHQKIKVSFESSLRSRGIWGETKKWGHCLCWQGHVGYHHLVNKIPLETKNYSPGLGFLLHRKAFFFLWSSAFLVKMDAVTLTNICQSKQGRIFEGQKVMVKYTWVLCFSPLFFASFEPIFRFISDERAFFFSAKQGSRKRKENLHMKRGRAKPAALLCWVVFFCYTTTEIIHQLEGLVLRKRRPTFRAN